jgi:hypothetical protein
MVTSSLIDEKIVGASKFSVNDPFKLFEGSAYLGSCVTGLTGTLGEFKPRCSGLYCILGGNMKTVKTVKPVHETFAGGCRFEAFSFGSIRIDGVTYEHDVLIDRGQVRKRKKKPSKKFREAYGHTPLSLEEKVPWKCRRLVIGTGTGALPVMDDVKKEAKRRHVQLLMLPTAKAIEELRENPEETNAILHVTC